MILLTAASMGLETVPQLMDEYGGLFDFFYYFTQAVFAIEISIRLLAFAPQFRKFFDDFWNTFDFVIVIASFTPGIGGFAIIARLLRVLRVLRILSVSDRLRGFTSSLHDTLDEIVYATLIMLVLWYIFGISGHYLFFEADPANWETLGRSMLSIFYMALLQDLKSFMEPTLQFSAASIVFFALFYLTLAGFAFSVLVSAISQAFREQR